MPVRHAFVSGAASSSDPAKVDGPKWNGAHLFIPTVVAMNTVAITWTNQPAGVTEFIGNESRRAVAILTDAADFRMYATVLTASAAAGAVLFPQFSVDGGATWADLQSGGTTTAGQIDCTAATTQTTGWNTIAAGAKADPVMLRIAGKTGGTATGDPQFGGFGLVFR